MTKPILSIITAMDTHKLIGKNNGLPWHLPEDLAFFKRTTLNKPIVMGRKTFESIGRPLPQRTNIIISRNKKYTADGCIVLENLDRVFDYCKNEKEIMLIGGASLYRQWLDHAQQMYITSIKGSFEGDAWFPDYDPSEWETVWEESHTSKHANKLEYKLIKLQRKN